MLGAAPAHTSHTHTETHRHILGDAQHRPRFTCNRGAAASAACGGSVARLGRRAAHVCDAQGGRSCGGCCSGHVVAGPACGGGAACGHGAGAARCGACGGVGRDCVPSWHERNSVALQLLGCGMWRCGPVIENRSHHLFHQCQITPKHTFYSSYRQQAHWHAYMATNMPITCTVCKSIYTQCHTVAGTHIHTCCCKQHPQESQSRTGMRASMHTSVPRMQTALLCCRRAQ